MPQPLIMHNIQEKIKELTHQKMAEWVAIRRHLHAHPELSFQEFNTSQFIQKKLTDAGIAFTAGWVKTGITAMVYGKNPESRKYTLRGDMDALPILEKNQVEYVSQNPGVMHACGHDVHTTCALGAAIVLHELRENWEGTVQIIFQPGEEILPGGASTDEIYIKIIGKGGHGAKPDKCIDPILISAHLITALQQVTSRWTNSNDTSVLTIGKIQGLGATNIIPDSVSMEGTFRTFNEEWRYQAHEKITTLCTQLAESMGAKAEVDIKVGYPALHNDPDFTEKAIQCAKAFLGEENVVPLSQRTTAEDFAYFAQHYPGCFYRLGTAGNDGTCSAPVHNNQFDIDENALAVGVGLMAYLAAQI